MRAWPLVTSRMLLPSVTFGPRRARAEGLRELMVPSCSATMIPSLSAVTTVVKRLSACWRAAAASIRSVWSAHTATSPH